VKTAIRAAIAALVVTGVAACGSNTRPAPTIGWPMVAGPGATTLGSAPGLPARVAQHAAADSTAPTGRPCPDGPADAVSLSTVNEADPDAVAEAVVITTNQSDARTDSSTLDALRRARRWLTPDLLTGSLTVPERPNAAWTALVAHCGYTTVDHVELANEYGQPANTAKTASIQITYRENYLGRDGWRGGDMGRQLARVHLIKSGHTWQVNAFD